MQCIQVPHFGAVFGYEVHVKKGVVVRKNGLVLSGKEPHNISRFVCNGKGLLSFKGVFRRL
ncbi:MAG: hypothetical protein ACKO6I_06835 [Sphingomonadales bacterium]